MTARPFTDEEMREAADALDDMLSGYQYEPPAPDPYKLVETETTRHRTAYGSREVNVPNHLYFVRCGDFVKIGIASDVRKRVRSMENGNPHELEILHVMAGKRKEEKDLHERFASYRHRDEWFRLEGQLADYIEDLKK